MTILRRFFLSHSTEKTPRGTVLCSGKVLVWTKILDERTWMQGRVYHESLSPNFRLTVPKFFVEEHFYVAENFWYRKMSRIKKGRVSRVFVKTVLSHSTESYRRRTLLLFKNFRVSKNFEPKRFLSRFYTENFWSDSAKKSCRGTF